MSSMFKAACKDSLEPSINNVESSVNYVSLYSVFLFYTLYYVHPPGGWIYYFCFFRRPMSDVRRPASGVRCPASRMVSAHLKEKY